MNRITNGNSTNMPVLTPSTTKSKVKDWQLEILMEKLRSKASQYKSLAEISKNVRMTLLEKRYALDSIEKSQHQKCLDTLQHSIKVKSLQSMVERLESLTRQLGLKFVVESSGVFISSDMFYLEIVLDQSGIVKDVKIHHEGKIEQQSCMELVNCLSNGDFTDFTAQLEGFVSIYQLNAEKKIKCKAFTALESLETDLSTLAQLQLFIKEPFNLLHKSPVGILEKRRGGHPMKLTYFVSPYDLLNVEAADIEPISVETVISKDLGYNVTICMEGSAAHKLQTTTLITVNRSITGKSTPSYSQLTNQNSATIPACFILKLNKPMPMCLSLVRQIQQIHPWAEIDSAPVHPLLSLIVTHSSDGKMDSANNKGLFVTLPDQNHCYFVTENKNMNGVLVNSIPFTHPAHAASILKFLREQALFNTIISSCVRPNSRQDFDNMTMFEISALSSTHISVSLEHPIEESMATAEIDLTDISNLVCRVHNPGTPPPPNTPDTASELGCKILNRTFSIPVTLRSIIKLWENQAAIRRNNYNGHENFSLPLGSGDPGGHKGGPGNGLAEYGGLDTSKIKQENTNNAGHSIMMHQAAHQGMFLNDSMMANTNFPNFPPSEGVLSNIELTNILSGATTISEKSNNKRLKQKTTDDLWCKSGKRKVGDDSESSCDSTSRSTPLSQDTEIPTPNSALGFQSDLELSSLDPAELIGVTDKSHSGFENIADFGDMEDILSGTARDQFKRKHEKSPQSSPNILSDLGDKGLVPPSVSITPISTASSPGFSNISGGNPDKRSGIEIIPLAQSPASLLSSSITITPITSSTAPATKQTEEKVKEKKSSKSRSSDDKNRFDKKRKRKRDESPMGPPEKLPPTKNDPLTKPVSVSIKPAESPPLPTPTSPSTIRKFNASPTQNRSVSSLSGKVSPNLMKGNLKTSSSHLSPKHSPAQIPSSPKHAILGISSPKNHGTSPKHQSISGSGKPSMSTLKSAANSPSSKTSIGESKNKSNSKDSSTSLREKEKKLAGMFSVSGSSKTKSSSSLKVKPLDLNLGMDTVSDGLPSPSGSINDPSKSSANQLRNRKGSLSAIVDKLKVNAQHCDSAADLSGKATSTGCGNNNSSRDRSNQSTGSSASSVGSKSSETKTTAKLGVENKNSEYMVKPSSDGIKITINKTRTKDTKSNLTSKSSPGTGSPKTHTGLKPGVNSGPASKKPQQSQKSGMISSINNSAPGSINSSNYIGLKSTSVKTQSSSSGSSNKLSASSNSLSKSLSKLSGSPKTGTSTATDLSRSKKTGSSNSKSNAEKSIFSLRDNRKSSPTPSSDNDALFKIQSKIDPYSSPLVMEGMMKQLDKNFQIPKLSARTTSNTGTSGGMDEKKTALSKSDNSLNNINKSAVDSKIFDMITKTEVVSNSLPKYPLAIPNKIFENSVDQKLRNNLNSIGNNQGKLLKDDDSGMEESKKNEMMSSMSGVQGKEDLFSMSTTKSFPTINSEPLSLSTKILDMNSSSKFVAPAPKDDKKDKNKTSSNMTGDNASELLLDFPSSAKTTETCTSKSGSMQPFPQSPSVSVHIVKSPVPSPLINPSPHSASPCITDDELMDEALIGLGK